MGGGNAPTVVQDLNTRELAQREFVTPLVVEAGAGTGKTALLVARVAAWCMGDGWTRHAEGDREPGDVARRVIERVVAITFTEAAAAEMARKIGEAFSQLAEGEEPVGWAPDPEAVPADRDESKARAGYLVAEAHRLSVSTIHSFCQRLLSTYPLEAGLHPRFVVDAEEEGIGALVEEVVEDLQDEYDSHEPDEDLFQKLGERDYLTSGRTEISQLADNFGIELPAIHYSTVAGFILHKTGSIPAKGRSIEEGRVTLTVHRRTAQAIQEVRIRWADAH